MKLYSIPTEVPAPKFDWQNQTIEQYDAECQKHREELKTWLQKNGWSGKNTGRTVTFSVADGQAEYMIAQAGPKTGRSSCIFHMPYLDGYHYRAADRFSFTEMLEFASQREKMEEYYNRNKGAA
jgi:hypothetical protein